jgi:iron complex transport system ATP-binding protein
MELIRLENVTFGYSQHLPAVQNVSLFVRRGEIISLLGPNGSGKTTLLKLILGMYRPEQGAVFFEGKPVLEMAPKALAKKIAYVPQFHRMVFAYRVMDVVLMGRFPHKSIFSRYSKHDTDIALHVLEKLSILHLKDKNYTEISGGERQLVLIARSLAQGADTLVMDEPASSLDYGNQIKLLDWISALAQEGYTFVKSTHFPDHALWIADRVVMLHKGSVMAEGKPDDIMSDEAVCRLYNTKVAIIGINGGVKTCIPQSIMKRGSS